MSRTPYWQESDDYRRGFNDGRIQEVEWSANYKHLQLRAEPMSTKTPLSKIRKIVPEGTLNIEAIHRNSGKGKSIQVRSNGLRLSFGDNGEDTGIADFDLTLPWMHVPLISGVYTFDHTDSRARPLLKGFTINTTMQVQWSYTARRIVTDFGWQNQNRIWWHRDRYNGSNLLIQAKDANLWWYGTPKQRAEVRKPHKGHLIKFLRSLDKIERDERGLPAQAVFVFDGEQWR